MIQRILERPALVGVGTAALLLTLVTVIIGGSLAGLFGSGAESKTPGDNETGAVVSCDAFGEIESFRFSVDLELDAPIFRGDEPTSNEATPDPLTAFGEALAALFSEMHVEGAFAAPDRTQIMLTFAGEEMELTTIGDQAWVRVGDEWEESNDVEIEEVVNAELVCTDLVADFETSLEGAEGERELVNGIEAVHYSFDEADVDELPDLLGGSSLDELPDEMAFDVWLAVEGGWPIKASFRASDVDDEGEPIELSLEMEIDDLNEEIVIEAPEE